MEYKEVFAAIVINEHQNDRESLKFEEIQQPAIQTLFAEDAAFEL